MKIPFCRVDCSGNEIKYVQEVLASGWLTTAGKCRDFEQKFAEKVGARYACAVNSATAALHLACEAVGIGPGDKVLVPTMTFTASAEIVRYLGADPVLLDVEYGTNLVTPEILQAAISRHPEAKALVLVHFGGQAAAMHGPRDYKTSGPSDQDGSQKADGILEVCRRHGVKVIEDAAHAFPTRWNERMVGSFGDATCFSFYANKTITTGEGGMLVTNDDAIYARAKVMRLHGIDRDIWNRFTSDKPSWEYDVVAPGFKYNMPDINAAIGLAQLERAEHMRKERQRCFEFYLENLADSEFLDLPLIRGVNPCPPPSTLNSPVLRSSTAEGGQLSTSSLEDHSCHLFWIVLNENASVTRNLFIELLAEAGIGTSVHYKPLHRMTYYRDRYGLKPGDFPNAERHWKGCVSLPVYPTLSNDELAYVVEQVKRSVGGR